MPQLTSMEGLRKKRYMSKLTSTRGLRGNKFYLAEMANRIVRLQSLWFFYYELPKGQKKEIVLACKGWVIIVWQYKFVIGCVPMVQQK